MAEQQRAVPPAVVRCMLIALALPVGLVGVRVLTAIPGYSRTRRGTIALQLFSRLALHAMGIRVRMQGSLRSGPSLVVANHVSWLDVLVLAAAAPILPLVDEAMLHRPIGQAAVRFGALHVRPGVSRDLVATVEQVGAALRAGHRVLAFPECGPAQSTVPGPVGTRESFTRAAFQAAVDAAVVISPVAISYSNPQVAQSEPDGLGSLWRILRSPPLAVRVTWLPVIAAVAGPGHPAGHRAAAARRTEWAIDRALGRRRRTTATPAVPLEQVPALALAS